MLPTSWKKPPDRSERNPGLARFPHRRTTPIAPIHTAETRCLSQRFRCPIFRSRWFFSTTPIVLLALASTLFSQVTPQDRLSESWWAKRHNALLAKIAAKPDAKLLLIGDSILNNYDKSNPPDENFQPIWKQYYAPRKALNLGFSGDTTANILWRLQNGEIEGIHPKAAILLIGTNDTARNQTAEQTEAGIAAIIAELEQRLPETHILLLGILPSSLFPQKTERDKAINQHLSDTYASDPHVTYLDIGSVFFNGTELNTAIFYDPRLPEPHKPLHPDTIGQRKMAEVIEPTLAKLMADLTP